MKVISLPCLAAAFRGVDSNLKCDRPRTHSPPPQSEVAAFFERYVDKLRMRQ